MRAMRMAATISEHEMSCNNNNKSLVGQARGAPSSFVGATGQVIRLTRVEEARMNSSPIIIRQLDQQAKSDHCDLQHEIGARGEVLTLRVGQCRATKRALQAAAASSKITSSTLKRNGLLVKASNGIGDSLLVGQRNQLNSENREAAKAISMAQTATSRDSKRRRVTKTSSNSSLPFKQEEIRSSSDKLARGPKRNLFLVMVPLRENCGSFKSELQSSLLALTLLYLCLCLATFTGHLNASTSGLHRRQVPISSNWPAPEVHPNGAAAAAAAAASFSSSVLHEKSSSTSLADLEAPILPPFSPTRRPLQTNEVQQLQPEVRDNLNNRFGELNGESERPILHGGSSAISGSNVPQNFNLNGQSMDSVTAAAATSNAAKFTRANELDTFLDEMNHNELRTVAAGRPIGGLFQPKQATHQNLDLNNKLDSMQDPHQASASSGGLTGRSAAAAAGPSGHSHQPQQLMGSHSEQQIYSECALILQRTYVKNIDDPKHQLVPFGKTEQACISYKHIDKAVEQAKHKLKFREFARLRKKPLPAPDDSQKPPAPPLEVIHSSLEPAEDLVAAIGELNMATTQIIADQFDLSSDELLNGLPLIDMSKTKFWDLCPLFVKQRELKCDLTRFRTFTGHCNNLKHPTWGAAKTPYARYLPPVHPDGIWVPRKSIVSEITFDLGIGHRETHAHIAPTMPIDSAMKMHDDFPAHFNDMAATSQAAQGVTLPAAEPEVEVKSGTPRRFGQDARAAVTMPSTIDQMAREAEAEMANELMGAHGESGDQQMASSVHFPMRQAAPPMDLMSVAMNAPNRGGRHQHHLSHFQHHQATLASAAANNHLAPPIIHQSHKSRSIPQELPSARLVTSIVHRDVDVPNHDFTVLFMSWGQLLDHDMTRAAQPPTSIKCCATRDSSGVEQPASKHKLCLPIQVPPNDPFYSKFNVKCLEFRRTLAGVRPNCVLGPRVHQNANTSPIDANFVYGSSQEMADGLRLFKGGRLRDRDWFHREHLKPLLPAQEIDPDLACINRPRDLFCFLAGDIRVNEQTHLTVLHTLYMREHNRLADKLSELNPHWDDERTFQEARHIVAATVQHVLINEYIPLLIGRKMSDLYNLTTQVRHHHHHHDHEHDNYEEDHHSGGAFWHGYDPSVTTSVSNSFAAAAFRQGHTFVQSTIDRFNKFHEFVSSEKLRHLFMQPFLLYQPGVMDELVSGLINRQSQSYDPFISEEISGHLFQLPEQEFGHDLAAINLQRGREQGLPGYNLFREWCGLPRAETFEQLEPYLTNHTAYQYSRLYKHVDDIDLWSGGISERKLPGAAIGPTFACIIARQFSNTRRGDRFWYENPGLPSSFTPDQLAELRKVTLAKLLCTNSDDLPTIQRWAFRMAHPILNPRVECHSLPEIDLQFWQEE